ncbi:hypothetical protein H3H54_14505 [Brachybacterium sp. Z12]|uniref:hypothetical protein n=1 Tax=Brachybacterium sp. Z12 TaxID=2759167 RepID=UPI00185FDC30|nr:hypothetical protein [Brachybacterium sp. Z12]QNN82268.1 hypothetical protein H3H54_14505 [Brachybacterium sp. Z12]
MTDKLTTPQTADASGTGTGQTPPRGTGPTAFDRHSPGVALTLYGAVILLIALGVALPAVSKWGKPEAIFATTVFIGTLVGGVGTFINFVKAISRDGWSLDVLIQGLQTLGVWVVCLGTLASITSP